MNWCKVAGGGGTSTGSVFTVTGTFGQHDAGGPMAGGGFSVMSGCWSPAGGNYFNPAGTGPFIYNGLQLTLFDSSAAGISAFVSGTPPIYLQWQKNGVNLLNETNSGLNLSLASGTYPGTYQLIAVSPYGSVTSSVAVPTYYAPNITTRLQSITNVAGSYNSFFVNADGNPDPYYYWHLNGSIISNAYDSSYYFQATNSGTYDVLVSNLFGTLSSSAILVVTNGSGPVIQVPPPSQTNVLGGIATFSVSATGNPALAYQWRLNGAPINSANSSNYTFLATSGGNFDVVLANYYGSITSSVAILTLTNGSAPTITTQPQSRTNGAGTVAAFSVATTGNPASSYQWRFNGSPVGGYGSTYAFAAAVSGNVDVVVVNYYGSITSSVAVLTVTNGYGYIVSSNTPFAFVDISATGTRVLAGLDDANVGANIGFTFNFFGVDYTALFIDLNGLISFSTGTSEYGNVNLTTTSPSADIPCLAVLWDDWVTLVAGTDAVYYQTLGTPGNRRFVVQWNNLFGYASPANAVTFEAILNEADKSILYQYLDVDSGDGRTNGANATVGIRNISGQLSGQNSQWSFNQPVILNGEAIQFSLVQAGYNRISGQLLTGGNVRVSYLGLAGTNYALDRTFNLTPPISWVPQITNPAGAGGGLIFTNTPVKTTNNFWRVRSVP